MKKFYILKNFKRAEISSKVLVTIILLILGFVLILIIYTSLNFENLSDEETCHTSVILRGSVPEHFTPLRCRTKKICITTKKIFGRGECLEFKNEKNVIHEEVDDLEDVERIIANEVIRCWDMMGRGKLSLFPNSFGSRFGLTDIYSSCVICSRIAFDTESLKKKEIDVSKRDVWKYIRTHNIPTGNISYYDFLKGEEASISIPKSPSMINLTLPGIGPVNFEKISNTEEEENLENKQTAIFFMQVSAPSGSEVMKNYLTALGVVGGSVLVSPLGRGSFKNLKNIIGICARSHLTAAGCAALVLGATSYVAYNIYDNKGISAAHCGDISVGDNARSGCSVVRVTEYSPEALEQFCNRIESIP
ncbi:MAG: hypothetical protein QXU40_00370 [Candidatus Pacearchaeota archaeon]